jgi:hypothetical protein
MNEEKLKRLDMKESLYLDILEYATNQGIEGRTRGERVLKTIEYIYNNIIDIDTTSMVSIDKDIKKKIKLFQMVGILDENDITKAINEALSEYIKTNKDILQQKIGEEL